MIQILNSQVGKPINGLNFISYESNQMLTDQISYQFVQSASHDQLIRIFYLPIKEAKIQSIQLMISSNTELSLKAERAFHEVYSKIFPYLDLQSLVKMLFVSQDFYEITNNYFKHFLISNGLIEHSTTDYPIDHYVRLFRSFYSRELLVTSLADQKHAFPHIQLHRYPRCSTYGIRDFDLGLKFTVFHLYNKDIIFLKTDEYLNHNFCMEFINRRNIRNKVEKFFTQGKNLYYQTITGQIYGIFWDEQKPSNEFAEAILDLTLTYPIKACSFSYKKAILFFQKHEEPQVKKNKDNKEKEESKSDNKSVKNDIRVWDINELTAEAINEPARLTQAVGIDNQDIVSFCTANNFAYFVDSKGKTYECDYSVTNNHNYMIEPYAYLKNKQIKKVVCSFTYFFAFEQEEIKGIAEWDKDQICKWLESKGFEDYVNIIKYENITGEQLLEADRQYLLDRIGVTREDLQIKMINEIADASKRKLQKPKFYAWGLNSSGQLGIDTGSNNVPQPCEVPLPFSGGNNKIIDIICGTKETIIHTDNAGIWITEPSENKKQAGSQNPKEKEVEKGEKGDKGKKSRKASDQIIETLNSRWINIQPQCEKFGVNTYKIVRISLSKDYLAILGANQGIVKPDEGSTGGKLKRADHIMHRILWDKKLNKQEFSVGFEDRFVGILEIPFLEFSEKTDIPMHRIRFFKRNGEIVWDRTKRINKL